MGIMTDFFATSKWSALEADKFAIQHIEASVLKEDVELMDKKFWDYKMMHPSVATLYFYAIYKEISARVLEREVGKYEASVYRTRMARTTLESRDLATIRAFWKARMAADAIGCKYDVFIRASIRNFRENYRLFASTKTAKRPQHMPYPAQLVSKPSVTMAIQEWSREKQARFPIPEHADIPNNTKLWFRAEMESWLIEEAKRQEFGKSHIERARAAGIILGAS